MNESQYQEPSFGDNSVETTQTRTPRNQSSYTPFITNRASNEETVQKIIDYIHDENKTQYGWLGNVFGTEKNASKNITFSILFFILLVLCILIFWTDECKINSHSFILNLLDKLLPLFTLAFGYFFGKQ